LRQKRHSETVFGSQSTNPGNKKLEFGVRDAYPETRLQTWQNCLNHPTLRKPKMTTSKHPNRRSFIASSTRLAAASTLGVTTIPKLPFGYHNSVNDTLKVGLVGCGGRGTGAALNAAVGSQDSNVEITALADAFKDRIDSCRESLAVELGDKKDKLKVTNDSCFTGFDCCEKLVASGVDVVLLAAPPHFRPAHLKACVEANKHVFVEKPVAVDVPGVKSILETCAEAEKRGLSIVSGLCWRYDWKVREMVKRIKEGAIGEIRAIQENYLTGTLWHRGDKPDWSRMEYQLRNWLYFNWLSGDHLAEQHIHSIDKALWLMDDKLPTSVYGTGARFVRTEPKWGNVYDSFACVFEWEDRDVKAFTQCRQIAGCFNDTDDYVYGTKGSAKILRGEIKTTDGVERVRAPENAPDSMYDSEHIEFFKSIRNGQPINNGKYMSYSTLMSLMGRDACYTGKKITTEDYWKETKKLGPENYAWNDYQPDPVPKPGESF
jgi:predicted dehydrogenase